MKKQSGRMLITVAIAVLLSGCSVLSNPANRNGLFDTQENDCSIFVGDAEYHGRVTESKVDGRAYIRRGACDDKDRAAYNASNR